MRTRTYLLPSQAIIESRSQANQGLPTCSLLQNGVPAWKSYDRIKQMNVDVVESFLQIVRGTRAGSSHL